MSQSQNLTSKEARQKAAATRRRRHSPNELISEAQTAFPPCQRRQIVKRLSQMPVSSRLSYLQAMEGNSPMTAIRAFCWMCMGWHKNDVEGCTDRACPLYPYRPIL